MFNFTKFLLETKNEFNGHKQTEIDGLTDEDIQEIVDDLRSETDCFFIIQNDKEGAYFIYQMDYWKRNDQRPVNLHRLILSGTRYKEK